jgi:hypothetical protein
MEKKEQKQFNKLKKKWKKMDPEERKQWESEQEYYKEMLKN